MLRSRTHVPPAIAVRVTLGGCSAGPITGLTNAKQRWQSARPPTVDGLFDVIASANARNAAVLDASYDASLGYPTSISIDYTRNVADDEITYSVSAFHAR